MSMRRSIIFFFVGIVFLFGFLFTQVLKAPISKSRYTLLTELRQLQTDEVLYYYDKAENAKITVPTPTEDLGIELHKKGTYKLYSISIEGKNVAVISQNYKMGSVYTVGPAVNRSLSTNVNDALRQYEAANAGFAFEDKVLIDTDDLTEKTINTVSIVLLIIGGVLGIVSWVITKRRYML